MNILKLAAKLGLIFSTLVIILISFQKKVFSEDYSATIAVFIRNGCQHCKDEEVFLEKLKTENKDIAVAYYRLENENEREIWKEFTGRLGISKVTPIAVIGDTYIIGFNNEKTTGKAIRELVQNTQKTNTPTDINSPNLKESGQKTSTCSEDELIPCTDNAKAPYYVTLPFIGKLDAQKYPLIALSALLGFFDGFNPCAMWVLVTFLIILLQVGSRKKMFVFAGTFILAEAIMYTLILTIWLKTWNFVKLDSIVTPLVGIVSITGGILFLKEWRKKELECKVTDAQHRAKTTRKIQDLAMSRFTLLTFLGILGIAFSVNIIEFACSIGIPQAFTKILELNRLSFSGNSAALAVYIIAYMIDDFVVFAIALWGIDKLALTTRYSKLSNLLGGIVMLILGFMLIFRLDLLHF